MLDIPTLNPLPFCLAELPYGPHSALPGLSMDLTAPRGPRSAAVLMGAESPPGCSQGSPDPGLQKDQGLFFCRRACSSSPTKTLRWWSRRLSKSPQLTLLVGGRARQAGKRAVACSWLACDYCLHTPGFPVSPIPLSEGPNCLTSALPASDPRQTQHPSHHALTPGPGSGLFRLEITTKQLPAPAPPAVALEATGWLQLALSGPGTNRSFQVFKLAQRTERHT